MSEKIRPFDNGGYFPIHNYVFDVCMPQLSNSGWRILCVAIRKTWGWAKEGGPMGRKEWDTISYSQFQEASGLKSRSSVSAGLMECLAANYLLRRPAGIHPGTGKTIYTYTLNVNYEASTEGVPEKAENQGASTVTVLENNDASTEGVLDASTVTVHTKVKESQSKDEKKLDGSFLKAWDAVLLELSMLTDKQTYNQWLKQSRIIAANNGTWTVQVSESALPWIQGRFRATIEKAMSRHAPGIELEFVA